MAETIFKKILAGDLPCYRIYEDTHCLAFLDVAPLSLGHVLVIPKEPAETMAELSDEGAAALGRILPRLCRAVMAASGTNDYNVLQNNGGSAHQGVMHVHFHIIPKPNEETGLGLVWKTQSVEAPRQEKMAQAIRNAL